MSKLKLPSPSTVALPDCRLDSVQSRLRSTLAGQGGRGGCPGQRRRAGQGGGEVGGGGRGATGGGPEAGGGVARDLVVVVDAEALALEMAAAAQGEAGRRLAARQRHGVGERADLAAAVARGGVG